ncbi:septal ring lytic transglycosylase RlpA family protein [Pelistega sp. MC2]|uniref:septal ring lytic transglycosylase RlpA family protein n=1 Tax=Pelistega sp. MC2 TaxID=1720297 RepID=UPI0009F3EE48|nr:septal ring lytic transglycosylase RlpA family protein [Pelistega sp. MC2]
MIRNFLTILGCLLLTPVFAQQDASQHSQDSSQHYRITVNGIFPDAPSEHTLGENIQKKFLQENNLDNDVLEESSESKIADVTVSLDNSVLKKDTEPKLRVDSTHTKKAKAYTVNGKKYVPFASLKEFSQVGIASWYGPGFHGRKTANGERFNQHGLTAAHKELPINSVVKVTRVSTGKSILVRINDRGPFHSNRVIDLSYGAAKVLGIDKRGSDKVKIELMDGQKNIH